MSISSEKVNCGGRVVVVVVVVGRRGRGFDVAGSGAGAGAVGLDLGGGLEDNKSMTSGIFFSVQCRGCCCSDRLWELAMKTRGQTRGHVKSIDMGNAKCSYCILYRGVLSKRQQTARQQRERKKKTKV